MSDEELKIEKLKLMGMFACIRIAPYMTFKDGTKGSVLLLRYNAEDSLVVLINSPERTDEYEYGKNNTLYPSEADQFYAYRQACIEKNEGHYCMSKEYYDEYGIVVLADVFVCAVIADFICDNINRQNRDSRRYVNWSTSRSSNMFSQALHGSKISEIEDEVAEFNGEDMAWQRNIISEMLRLYHADKVFFENINLDWKKIRDKYAEWLEHDDMTIKLCFAVRILQAYKEQPNRDWRRLLEETTRNREQQTEQFRYSNYGVQEIIGLYALSKYYYKEKPDVMDIHYAHVSTAERVALYKRYNESCTSDMLAELNAEDDPLRTKLPDKKEAEEKSKLRIARLVGRQPIGLTDEQKDTYSKYAQGYCMERNIPYPAELSVMPCTTQEVHPKVFISYSWDDKEHEEWVLKLAKELRSNNGIDVILDKWDMKLGKPLTHFMAHAVTDSDRVICVMTPNYKKKTENLDGGVGVEYSIITAEIQKDIQTEKFIPLFRSGEDVPTFLAGRDYIDMRDDSKYDEAIEELVRDIFNKPKYKKPELGAIPKLD